MDLDRQNRYGNEGARDVGVVASGQANGDRALTPDSPSGESYDEMLDMHHDSLLDDTAATSIADGIDGLFASSVQNLYDANGKVPQLDVCVQVQVLLCFDKYYLFMTCDAEMEVPFIDLVTSVPITHTGNMYFTQIDETEVVDEPFVEEFVDRVTSSDHSAGDARNQVPGICSACQAILCPGMISKKVIICFACYTGEAEVHATLNGDIIPECLKFQTNINGEHFRWKLEQRKSILHV